MSIAKTRPLLPTNALTYLRRLVKELHSLPDGFYYNGVRYTRASATATRFFGQDGHQTGILTVSRRLGDGTTESTSANPEQLSDVYGRNVCATRAPIKSSKRTC